MKRLAIPLSAATLAMAAAGCDATETAVVLKGIVNPTVSNQMGQVNCMFPNDDPSEFRLHSTLDVAASFKLSLPVAVENRLIEFEIDVDEHDVALSSSFHFSVFSFSISRSLIISISVLY